MQKVVQTVELEYFHDHVSNVKERVIQVNTS